MRIVYYSPGWPPARFPNGIVTALGRLAPALRAHGHDVRILAGRGEADGQDVTIVDQRLSSRDAPWLRAARRIVAPHDAVFRQAPVRIVQTIKRNPGLNQMDVFEIEESFGWNAVIARELPAPVVVRLHGPWFMNGAALTDGALTRLDQERIRREGEAIAAAEAVTAPSHFVLEAVRNRYGLKLSDAVVIANPAPSPPESEIWRAEKADFNEILFVGRFDRHKGADILLRTFGLLAANRPGLKLTFAGPNDQTLGADGRAYRCKEYVEAAMPPDAARRVTFLGPVPLSGIGRLRARAGVTVVASRVETFGNVLIEALSHGSPVAAARAGAIAEIARDGETAMLADPDDPAALARAVVSLLDDPALAARLGAAAQRDVESGYAAEKVAERTVDAYANIIDRRASGHAATGV